MGDPFLPAAPDFDALPRGAPLLALPGPLLPPPLPLPEVCCLALGSFFSPAAPSPLTPPSLSTATRDARRSPESDVEPRTTLQPVPGSGKAAASTVKPMITMAPVDSQVAVMAAGILSLRWRR